MQNTSTNTNSSVPALYPILHRRFYGTLIALILLFVLNVVANYLSLYWIYKWFDIPMHFIGGAIVSCGWYVIVAWYKKDLRFRWIQALIGSFVIGFAWEVIEYISHVAQLVPHYYLDSAKDLCMDMLGGLVAYLAWNTDSLKKYNDGMNN